MISSMPFLIFYLGAILTFLFRGKFRLFFLLMTPLAGLLNLLWLGEGSGQEWVFFGEALHVTRVDRLSWLFGVLFHLAAFLCVIFSLHLKDRVQQIAGLLYAGSAIGAVFAANLIVFLIFCELLALTSVFFILMQKTARSYAASMRYLFFHTLSGGLLLSGIVLHFHETGSLDFDHIGLGGLSSWLILLAFGIKAGFPFVHNWLTEAYAEATPTGSVFLSIFTTKVAVYALARGYAGTEVLVYVGAVMAVFPIFFAMIENDLRRVLSYSLINQVGFMVCGIGVGTELAINGAVGHAFNDVLFKGLLFMSMGAVLFRTGSVKVSELGGLYKSMPWTTAFCLTGAASISAVPLFSGFVSKSMIMLAVLEAGYPVVWLALLFAAAGVLHYTGIKVPFFAFFARDRGKIYEEAPRNMLIAMGVASLICIFNGVYPWLLYSYLPYPVLYEPYTVEHILTQSQMLLFSALAFVILYRSGLYPSGLPGVNLDAEWFYRKAIPNLWHKLVMQLHTTREALLYQGRIFSGHFISFIRYYDSPSGVLARSRPTGAMLLIALAFLGVYVVLLLWGT